MLATPRVLEGIMTSAGVEYSVVKFASLRLFLKRTKNRKQNWIRFDSVKQKYKAYFTLGLRPGRILDSILILHQKLDWIFHYILGFIFNLGSKRNWSE